VAKLTLIRGIPGSGKSTLAKGLVATATGPIVHLEADMYMLDEDGNYLFDPEFLEDAHYWCQYACNAALEASIDVVVSNTFIQKWEILPYLSMESKNVQIKVIEMPMISHGSIHDVPENTIEHMKNKWEVL